MKGTPGASELVEHAPAAGPAAAPRPRPGRRERIVRLYLVLALLLLVPGLLASLHLGLDEATLPGAWLAAIDQQMRHIAFGHTPRFWMGVAGATMMALLLLYPLRKLFGIGSSISVAAWFHLHTIVGLLGPVLILYHAYFGTGSTPANVALATTLTVALSGIFGFFVHTRLNARFHDEAKRALGHLHDTIAALQQLPASPSRTKFFDALEAYQREASTGVRRGWGSAAARDRDTLLEHALWLVDNQGQQDGWSSDRRREAGMRVAGSLDAYFAALRGAARRSHVERVARLWRLLHLPLFYVTIVATLIHVYKVWDMDVPPSPALESRGGAPTLPGAEGQVGHGASSPSDQARSRAERAPRPAPFTTRTVTTAEVPVASSPAAGPAPLPEPEEKVAQPPPRPKPSLPPRPAAAPSAEVPPTPPKAPDPDPVGELARQVAQWDNTGTLDPAVVKERLAHYKADASFSHDRTRFPLIGKHKTLACESCHKTTLKDTPKGCVDCHKKDDVHRGRRPNCESCHVPSDWGTIKRRG